MATRHQYPSRVSPTAIVLAGGEGTRLAAARLGVPKPMAPIRNQPFLTHLIRHLRRCGVRSIILVIRGRDAIIRRTLRAGTLLGVRIRYVTADPGGTGRSLARALRIAGTDFLVLNGDTYCTFDPTTLRQLSDQSGVVLALVRKRNAGRYGSVTLDRSGRVVAFREKGRRGSGLVYAGALRANRSTLAAVLRRRAVRSLEYDAFPALVRRSRLFGQLVRGTFYDIGTPSAYRRFSRHFVTLRP